MSHARSPDTTWTKCPLRKIVERWVEFDPALPQYPVSWHRLECGHEMHSRGQNESVRCGYCFHGVPAPTAAMTQRVS